MHTPTRAALAILALTTAVACGAEPMLDAPTLSGDISEQALLWNGFRHDWGYNHRVNRLGDYTTDATCQGDTCAAGVVHTAASGTGSDDATFRSRHTAVVAPGVGFQQGFVGFEIAEAGAEGERIERRQRVTIPADGLLAGRDQHEVVLGGFDVLATGDPDKLQELSIDLGDVTYDADAGTLSFTVDLTLQVDCDSGECDLSSAKLNVFDKTVDYQVYIVYTVIGADAADLQVTTRTLTEDYTWDKAADGEELRAADHTADVTLAGKGGPWATAAVAFKSLSVILDDDHHMVGWNTTLRPDAYDAAAGSLPVSRTLMFKQWNEASADKLLSYTTAGEARITAEVALLQFAQGCAQVGDTAGTLRWDADGKAVDSDASRSDAAATFAAACR